MRRADRLFETHGQVYFTLGSMQASEHANLKISNQIDGHTCSGDSMVYRYIP